MNKVAIIGKSASGKTELLKEYLSKELNSDSRKLFFVFDRGLSFKEYAELYSGEMIKHPSDLIKSINTPFLNRLTIFDWDVFPSHSEADFSVHEFVDGFRALCNEFGSENVVVIIDEIYTQKELLSAVHTLNQKQKFKLFVAAQTSSDLDGLSFDKFVNLPPEDSTIPCL